MDASLQDFLRTGRLGALGLGTTQDEVQAQLGRPATPSTACWTYGDLQLVFEEGAVHSLVLIPPMGRALDTGSALRLDPWEIKACLGLEVARAVLSTGGIGFEEGDDPQNPGVRLLVTAGDVALIFSVDPDETTLPLGLFMIVCTRD